MVFEFNYTSEAFTISSLNYREFCQRYQQIHPSLWVHYVQFQNSVAVDLHRYFLNIHSVPKHIWKFIYECNFEAFTNFEELDFKIKFVNYKQTAIIAYVGALPVFKISVNPVKLEQ